MDASPNGRGIQPCTTSTQFRREAYSQGSACCAYRIDQGSHQVAQPGSDTGYRGPEAQDQRTATQAERQIAVLDAEIAALIARREPTARNSDILRSIPGSGKITVAAVLNFMPEIDGLERKQVARLAELAPITLQSGQWQGKVFIQGGRKPLRDTLYMPALVAMRFNLDLKAK